MGARQSKFAYIKFVDVKGPDDCWPWKGAKTRDGYGRFGAEGTQWFAHRLAFEAATGIAPVYPAQEVMHSCHNPSCCNPRHLLLGTKKQNLSEAGLMGRLSRKGYLNGNSKLTLEQVEAIRKDNRPSRIVASENGIEKTQVLRIRKGVQWA